MSKDIHKGLKGGYLTILILSSLGQLYFIGLFIVAIWSFERKGLPIIVQDAYTDESSTVIWMFAEIVLIAAACAALLFYRKILRKRTVVMLSAGWVMPLVFLLLTFGFDVKAHIAAYLYVTVLIAYLIVQTVFAVKDYRKFE